MSDPGPGPLRVRPGPKVHATMHLSERRSNIGSCIKSVVAQHSQSVLHCLTLPCCVIIALYMSKLWKGITDLPQAHQRCSWPCLWHQSSCNNQPSCRVAQALVQALSQTTPSHQSALQTGCELVSAGLAHGKFALIRRMHAFTPSLHSIHMLNILCCVLCPCCAHLSTPTSSSMINLP